MVNLTIDWRPSRPRKAPPSCDVARENGIFPHSLLPSGPAPHRLLPHLRSGSKARTTPALAGLRH